MAKAISKEALDQLFHEARSHRSWSSEPVSVETLKAIYETMKFGPTSANNNPLRILFVLGKEAKERLLPHMAEGNRDKTAAAPAVVVFAYDPQFFNRMDILFPGRDFGKMFAENPAMAEKSAFQNSTLQSAYFMIAARAYGLDCGPMGGFDSAGVDKEFFGESGWKSTMVCNLGHGDGVGMFPRLPRLEFDDACVIL